MSESLIEQYKKTLWSRSQEVSRLQGVIEEQNKTIDYLKNQVVLIEKPEFIKENDLLKAKVFDLENHISWANYKDGDLSGGE